MHHTGYMKKEELSIFSRDAYQDLLAWKKELRPKPLIVRGARQVGKTFLIKEFAKNEYKNFHYINFEMRPDLSEVFNTDLVPERILKDLERVLRKKISLKNDLIIFDEIQECPNAITSLKYFNEDLQQAQIISAGSLIGVRLGKTSFPVGKISFLDCTPLNFVEFLKAIGRQDLSEFLTSCKLEEKILEILHKDIWHAYKQYLYVGGLPEVVDVFTTYHESEEKVAYFKAGEKQQELISAYSSDIAKHAGQQNSMHITRVWSSVPRQLAREVNAGARKFRFKDVLPGKGFRVFSGPIDWLVAADLVIKNFIVETAEIPFGAYVKENRFKLFSFDIGILGRLASISAENIIGQDYGSYKGYYAENFVAQELKNLGGKILYSWNSGRTAEVEFLLNIAGEIVPIEVKSGLNRRSKSLKIYHEKYKPKLQVILSANNELKREKSGKLKIPLYMAGQLQRFLLNT